MSAFTLLSGIGCPATSVHSSTLHAGMHRDWLGMQALHIFVLRHVLHDFNNEAAGPFCGSGYAASRPR